MKQDGIPVKTIQEILKIKSESQVYAWWYWYRDGDLHRLEQPAGKQYTFDHGPEGSTKEEVLFNQYRSLKTHNEEVVIRLCKETKYLYGIVRLQHFCEEKCR